MEKIQSGAAVAGGIFVLLMAIIGIPGFFIWSDMLSKVLIAVTGLHVDPSYIGGEEVAVVYDPLGDDYGGGSLTYPDHTRFTPGSLDIVRYRVGKPVWHAQWVPPREYWQLEIMFAGGEAAARTVMIYIDMDGDGRGSTATLEPSAEEVSFDPAHPWDWAVRVSGDEGMVYFADSSEPVRAAVFNETGKTVVRIPLTRRNMQHVYTAGVSWQYVLVGARDMLGGGNFADPGGGAGLTPKIYDMPDSGESGQREMLRTRDISRDRSRPAVISPVRIDMKNRESNRIRFDLDAGSTERMAQRIESLGAEERAKALERFAALDSLAPITERAEAAFDAGENGTAEALFDRILEAEPENTAALAYKGSLTAMRASEASVFASVSLVNEAFTYLDAAVLRAAGESETITARMNRGSVAMAVPDMVFGKALIGAYDFIEAGKRLQSRGDTGSAMSAFWYASRCFEAAGKDAEAGIWLREAFRLFEEAGQ